MFGLPCDGAIGSVQCCDGLGSSVRIADGCDEGERRIAGRGVEIGVDFPIAYVCGGDGGEFDAAIQSVQAPEVLVFEPCCATEFEARDGKGVVAFLNGIGHVEFTRCEGIFGVADECTVQPHVDGGGCGVEGERDLTVFADGAGHGCGRREFPAVQRHVVVLRNVRLLRILMAVPWVLHVDVLRFQQALGFQIRWHFDG